MPSDGHCEAGGVSASSHLPESSRHRNACAARPRSGNFVEAEHWCDEIGCRSTPLREPFAAHRAAHESPAASNWSTGQCRARNATCSEALRLAIVRRTVDQASIATLLSQDRGAARRDACARRDARRAVRLIAVIRNLSVIRMALARAGGARRRETPARHIRRAARAVARARPATAEAAGAASNMASIAARERWSEAAKGVESGVSSWSGRAKPRGRALGRHGGSRLPTRVRSCQCRRASGSCALVARSPSHAVDRRTLPGAGREDRLHSRGRIVRIRCSRAALAGVSPLAAPASREGLSTSHVSRPQRARRASPSSQAHDAARIFERLRDRHGRERSLVARVEWLASRSGARVTVSRDHD